MKIATKTLLVIITAFLSLVLVSTTACGVTSSWDITGEIIETGKPTTATFWVTVPYNTPQQDTLLLSIEG